jgi:hypothetical protein
MSKILHTFKFCEHDFNFVQVPDVDQWSTNFEVVGLTRKDSDFLYSNEEMPHAVFEYGRCIWLANKDNLKETEVKTMTLEDAQKIKEGMEVNYQGYSCLVRKIMFFGGSHPYWILAPEMGMPKVMRQKIGSAPISYAACEPV